MTQITYISDPNDQNHLGKIVLPAHNHNCASDGPEAFLSCAIWARENYLRCREGRRGKRTAEIWSEYIYSSEKGTIPRTNGCGMEPCLSYDERKKAEQAILAGPFRNAKVRWAWHICRETGRCDCHFLVSKFDHRGVVWENDGFGNGQKNLKLELERVEENLLKELNAARPLNLRLRNARQAHIAKREAARQLTFAQKLAQAGWDGNYNNLEAAVERTGFKLIKRTTKQVTVQNPNAKKVKTITYHLTTLAMNCLKEQKLFLTSQAALGDIV